MHICIDQNKQFGFSSIALKLYVFQRELNNVSDGAHLTSFRKEIQKDEDAKENELTASVSVCTPIEKRHGVDIT